MFDGRSEGADPDPIRWIVIPLNFQNAMCGLASILARKPTPPRRGAPNSRTPQPPEVENYEKNDVLRGNMNHSLCGWDGPPCFL